MSKRCLSKKCANRQRNVRPPVARLLRAREAPVTVAALETVDGDGRRRHAYTNYVEKASICRDSGAIPDRGAAQQLSC
ncbi:unnamed protein product [Heligmosomoides polygyrus]|uniref:Transposase n=1 Tax=Heligmosomoides polygyrus TaxID=6339 RepID=A0A183FZX6_HELPZ|nr:unnamed protein product [Heligmosomoides polygyrus]